MPGNNSTPWLVDFASGQPTRTRVFCFPPAGSGASMFFQWKDVFGQGFTVHGVQYPGHETRLREPFARSAVGMAEMIAAALRPTLDDKPYVFFGHSFGALIAFETARRLQAEGRPLPCRLIVSGRRAPGRPPHTPALHTLDDVQLLQKLRQMAGTPEEVLGNKEIMALLLPIVRADLAMDENHLLRGEKLTGVATTVFHGRDDPIVPIDQTHGWQDVIHGLVTFRDFPGGHFFFQERASTFFSELEAILTACG